MLARPVPFSGPAQFGYAKDLLFNVNFYVHPEVTAYLYEQYADREPEWFDRMEMTLDLYQFNRVRTDAERYGLSF